jgi:hypothetical protein
LFVIFYGNENHNETDKIKIALDKAIQKIIAEEKVRNGYLVVSDSNGNIKKIPAKDL